MMYWLYFIETNTYISMFYSVQISQEIVIHVRGF